MEVFIRYSRRDAGAVRSTVADLEPARVQVRPGEDFGGGDGWWATVLNEIRDSRADANFSQQRIDDRNPTAATGPELIGALHGHAAHHRDPLRNALHE
jgi:hypothetical protein